MGLQFLSQNVVNIAHKCNKQLLHLLFEEHMLAQNAILANVPDLPQAISTASFNNFYRAFVAILTPFSTIQVTL